MAVAPRSRVTLRPDAIAFDPAILPPPDRTYSHDFATESLLGEGGMGRVLSARDIRLGRRVAIKELRPEIRDRAELWGRFVREAQIGAQLEHPNIVPIYGFELSPEGGPAFVMQLIDGESLAAYLDRAIEASRGPRGESLPPLKERIAKLLPVLDAIAYAHGRGVLHRDLKPDNVMLGAHNVVLVTDWGIARLEGDEARPGQESPASAGQAFFDGLAGSATIVADQGSAEVAPTMVPESGAASTHTVSKAVQTALGSVLGTAQYMSPEQAVGQVVGPASDQYALGLMLLELATLRTARSHESTQVAYSQAISGERCTHVTLDGDALDPRLSAIIDRATQKEPGNRYPDVVGLGKDLRAFLLDDEVSVAPDSLARKLARHVQAHPGRAVSAVAFVLLAFAALAISSLSQAASRAEAARADSESLSRLSAAVQADREEVERYLLGYDAELLGLAEVTRVRLEQPLPRDAAPIRIVEPSDFRTRNVPGLVRSPRDGLLRSYREPVFVFLPGARPWARDAAQHLAPGKADLIDLYVAAIDEGALRRPREEREALMATDHDGFVRLIVALESGLFVQFPASGEFPPDYDPRDADWYHRATATAGSTFTRPKYGPLGRTPRIALVRAVTSRGQLLGAANAGVWVKSVVRKLDRPGARGLAAAFVAAPDGKEVVSQRVLDVALATRGEPEGLVPLPGVASAKLRDTLAKGRQQGYLVEADHLYVYSRLAVEDWYLVHRYRRTGNLQLVR